MSSKKARELVRGDIIRYTNDADQEIDEVIREVVIVLRMANGESLSVATTATFELVPPEIEEAEESSPAIVGEEDSDGE